MLRTRSPVYSPLRTFSLDLHVLGTPPAFVLSQDQTLQFTFLATPSLVSLDLEWSAPGLTSLQTSLKALRFRNLLRGLAIRFSKTERPATTSDDQPPCPASRRGRALYRCPRFRVKDAHFRPRARPHAAGGASCNTGTGGCQEPCFRAAVFRAEPSDVADDSGIRRGRWQTR